MDRPVVLVVSRFLRDQCDAWNDGYDVISPSECVDGIANRVEVIVSGGELLDTRLVDALPNLKLVACFATGYAGIDLAHLRSHGIALTTAAGVNAHDVADHAIALMLAWWHGTVSADRAVRETKWRDGLVPRLSLRGRRAGIVGFGRIGREIARRAEALGLSVQWWGPRDKPDAPYRRSESLLALARESDILFVASRATPANLKQIDSKVLAALGAKGCSSIFRAAFWWMKQLCYKRSRATRLAARHWMCSSKSL